MQTLRETIARFTGRLSAANVDSPRLSAEVLLALALRRERSDLIKDLLLHPDSPVDEATVDMAEKLVQRREKGEPVAYIAGRKEFYGRDFTVTPATLIPRPDTETLVETALAFAGAYPQPNPCFLDLGTGSGAIAVTLGLELPAWRGTAVDISPDALRVAEQNARTLRAANLDFVLCDFLGPDLPNGPYSMVLANPPYVSEEEYSTLSREIAGFEPKSALVPPTGNADGLEHLSAILHRAESLLVSGGLLLMEMDYAQGDALLEKSSALSFLRDCHVVHDLAGLPRVFHAIRL